MLFKINIGFVPTSYSCALISA